MNAERDEHHPHFRNVLDGELADLLPVELAWTRRIDLDVLRGRECDAMCIA